MAYLILLWHGSFDSCLRKGESGGHQADVGEAFLHDHHGKIGLLHGITGIRYALQVNAVPARLLKPELLPQLDFYGMELAHLDELALLGILAVQSQRTLLHIKIHFDDLDVYTKLDSLLRD